ncbi:MAG: hypothetical protein JSR99_08440 [Proteobacteria bacterium]|nr:hypothetical protein [Pseudomonadota bacterium]
MTHLIKLASERTRRDNEQAKVVRDDLLEKCAAAVDAMGTDIAGYALVVWNKTGDMRTAYDASQGPVGPALVPTLAADALNRHVAVMLAKTANTDETD